MINEKDLDFNVWKGNCEKFKRNRNGLGFETKFTVENGYMNIGFENVDEKYIPALKQLALSCAHGAIAYMNHTVQPNYALKDDEKEEQKKCSGIIQKNAEELLKILFNSNIDAFMEATITLYVLLATKYELNHVELIGGKFVYGDKFMWTGESWVDASGMEAEELFITPWSKLLPQVRASKRTTQDQKRNIA